MTPVNDEYGHRLRLLPPDLPNGEDLPVVIVHTDLQDLIPGRSTSLPVEGRLVPDGSDDRADLNGPAAAEWLPVSTSVGTQIQAVEVAVIGDFVVLRGSLKHTYTSGGTFLSVGKLPRGVPLPQSDLETPVYGIESGVSYRVGLIRVDTSGTVQVACGTGKFTEIKLDAMWPAG